MGEQGATRLDRLFLLLENGTNAVTRNTAAEQIGEVARLYPHKLHSLLHRIRRPLLSDDWDARIAAGQAIEAIAKACPRFDVHARSFETGHGSLTTQRPNMLTFASVTIDSVVDRGKPLLASGGKEYDMEMEDMSTGERLQRQRDLMAHRLGLDDLEAGGTGDTAVLFDDEDLIAARTTGESGDDTRDGEDTMDGVGSTAGGGDEGEAGAASKAGKRKREVKEEAQDLVDSIDNKALAGVKGQDVSRLSARERNRLKRKARRQGVGMQRSDSMSKAGKKARRGSKIAVTDQAKSEGGKVVVEHVPVDEEVATNPNEWPFEVICEELLHELFRDHWEVRHGAGVGLRELLRVHGDTAGHTVVPHANEDGDDKKHVARVQQEDTVRNQVQNQQWIEDAAVRLCCVLALDRFGDYGSDQVVAPVRETCAQTLGVLSQHMPKNVVANVLSSLMPLLKRSNWQTRHAGLTGVKYVLAVRQDLMEESLPTVLPFVFQGLSDRDDDVRVVAAETLLPVASHVVKEMPARIPELLGILWHTLTDLNDLTSSTASVMALLSRLYECDSVTANLELQSDGQPVMIKDLVPRLWPFLRHYSQAVRLSAVRTLDSLLNGGKDTAWLIPIMEDSFNQVFQNFILEEDETVLQACRDLWITMVSVCPNDKIVEAVAVHIERWIALLVAPEHRAFADGLLLVPKFVEHVGGDIERHKKAGHDVSQHTTTGRQMAGTIWSRQHAVVALGNILVTTESAIDAKIVDLSNTTSGLARSMAALTVTSWAQQRFAHAEPQSTRDIPAALMERMLVLVGQDSSHTDQESAPLHAAILQAIEAVLRCYTALPQETLVESGVTNLHQWPATDIEGLAAQLITGIVPQWDEILSVQHTNEMLLTQRRECAAQVMTTTGRAQQMRLTRILEEHLTEAGAIIAHKELPPKLNAIIHSIMRSVRGGSPAAQDWAAMQATHLLVLIKDRTPNPTPKILKNLRTSLCDDRAQCPDVLTGRRHPHNPDTDGPEPPEITAKANSSAGAAKVFQAVGRNLGDAVFTEVPSLLELTFQDLTTRQATLLQLPSFNDVAQCDQALVDTLCLTRVLGSQLTDGVLMQQRDAIISTAWLATHAPAVVVQQMAAECLAALARVSIVGVMSILIEHVLPQLGDVEREGSRYGAALVLHGVVKNLGVKCLPFSVLLLVPLLGRMSDQATRVRTMATKTFAELITILPLESGAADLPGMSPALCQERVEKREFVEQLLDTSKLADYPLAFKLNGTLRRYQQDGVNWLAFLNKYNLHGILCDDMGLGKTLQTISILTSDKVQRAARHQQSHQPADAPLPSLVVCPTSLVDHWHDEILHFTPQGMMKVLKYVGSPSERIKFQDKLSSYDVVVTTYAIIARDASFFARPTFNYCVLDEGHVIKNPKSKTSLAVKSVTANHRLILSGTPIQNNVLELWSLFDFLMPGFLGTESQFNAMYAKPVFASRDPKSSTEIQTAGALALETLHRQVLPFLLRRMKEEVLHDLPPKIIQDLHCRMSPLQMRLYKHITKVHASAAIGEAEGGTPDSKKHIFAVLQSLRQLCGHPFLVLGKKHDEYDSIISEYTKGDGDDDDSGKIAAGLTQAPKLQALKQLLLDCGIGVEDGPDGTDVTGVSAHRTLIFCQTRGMLDMIEQYLFQPEMPSVSYLRMDGNTKQGARQNLVNAFNSDPSIDCLLLTTRVGGLGLNLTGADTVIFVEHDWNPSKDMQAMDRAHRIGQTKVVNVYRLITLGTIEEKVMSLQKFKQSLATSVVNTDNASLASMQTGNLFDLFSVSDDAGTTKTEDGQTAGDSAAKAGQGGALSGVLAELGEMWDPEQYTQEYDMNSFLGKLT